MTQINVELVTPQQLVFSSDVDMVTIPGKEGDFGVLHGHVPMISSIRPGVITLDKGEGTIQQLYVEGGFAEVTSEGCTILATKAVDLKDMSESEKQELLK